MEQLNAEPVRKELFDLIKTRLTDIGLMFRLFSRVKERSSLERKLEVDNNYGVNKKIQDLIGLRVVLYFNDDLDVVRNVLSKILNEKEQDVSIDINKADEFKATRYNIIYELSDSMSNKINYTDKSRQCIDNTFELQVRTIFSEGWHEIEHDLRYKCPDDWNCLDGKSRMLNGVYATLETSEWTMIKIFDELAYSHYKNKRWVSMFRQKLRLRIIDVTLEPNLKMCLENEPELGKSFYRLNRNKLISDMSSRGFYYPVTLQNLIYFANLTQIKNDKILGITPAIMIDEMGCS